MHEPDTVFREPLQTASRLALAFLADLDRMPVAPRAGLDELRQRLGGPLNDDGIAPEQVVTELAAGVEDGLVGSAGGRFYGWVVGGSLPAALAADWLTSTWDQNASVYASGPAAAVVEEIAGAWLKDILGLPAAASFALVTGCQMAHTTCLAAARHALLRRRGWDVEQRGLFGAPPIRLLTSIGRHGTFERAIRLLGIGMDQIQYLASDDCGKLREDALEEALRAVPDAPTLVLLQAGEINIGSYDSFQALVPIAKKYSAWVHVDGAFGLWAGASPKLRHLTAGVEACDSWATDGHKWLNVPYDCGYAIVADPDAHRACVSYRAPYLTHDSKARDQVDWTPEWSRRARGFSTYAALRQLGRKGVADLVERCSRHTHSLVTRIGALRGAEMLWEPVINQGLVRFPDPRPGATEEDHDRHTDRVIEEILATGEAFLCGTTWRGRRAMRVSVCNWQTSEQDVDRAVRAAAAVLATAR
jgi:glutamate/tyrosine decarboxylase-like PLP-dependent enzyme